MPRHLHIDPFNGIAGDMLLAALVDLGAPVEPIAAALQGVAFPGVSAVALSFPEARGHGVGGLRLEIELSPSRPRGRSSLGELRRCLEQAPLPDRPRRTALRVLELIGRAEAETHGVEPDEVHFHELGGFDTVVDLVGVAVAIDSLGVDSLTCDPLPLSRGRIRCEHGTLPSPAPSTLVILQGAPVRGLDVEGEIVTPTGAALAVTLASSFGPPPPMTLLGSGVGFGSSTFPGRPNCLRLILGETEGAGPRSDSLWVLEANLDDLSPEILATLPESCLSAGALDAWLAPILMKKGRPAHVLHALCPTGSVGAVQEALFRLSSTLGVRRFRVERDALNRTWEPVQTPWGEVRVKIGWLGQEPVNRAPEFEDCRRVAAVAGVPVKDVYASALGAAMAVQPPEAADE